MRAPTPAAKPCARCASTGRAKSKELLTQIYTADRDALGQLPAEEGVPLLIEVARTHSNAAVKKQAMFWPGQSKDRHPVDFLAEILKHR